MSKAIASIVRYLVTLGAVIVAGMVLASMFREYLFHPWTRDGHVRAQVIKITPRVGGPIVDLPIHDNQAVSRGDLLFWNAVDLERKLADFQAYYNYHRTHRSLGGDTPTEIAGGTPKLQTKLKDFRWQNHCRGIYQLPAAA